jgi:spoIIIJ-associated protein
VEWVEITSKTVQEATEQALDTLGVDEADAEIQVVEEPQPGLFGRTRGKARVRARVVPKQHPPKQERRERRRSSGGGRGRGRDAASDAPSGSDAASEAPSGSDVGSEADASVAATADNASTNGDGTGGSSGNRRRRRGRSGGQGGGRSAASSGDGRDNGPRAEQGDSVEPTLTLDEHVEAVETFVRGLVEAFGIDDATIEVAEVDDETREVQVTGNDLGLLIGPRGLTLQAVHELARTVVYRAAPGGQDGRVRIDIGGYRERRRQALEAFATKIAEEVASSGTARALEPMSPPDRKVVHDTINGVDGVRTTSEGEEPRRRVVVLPDS